MMNLEHSRLRDLAIRCGGSFYIFDSSRFSDNYRRFHDSFASRYRNTRIAYSFKANYMPEIGRLLAAIGGMAEVVSRMEYDIALLHLQPEQVIFNGPIKGAEDLGIALRNGSMVNIDSFREVALLEALAAEFPKVEVGVRVNLDTEESVSRFGFCTANGDLQAAVERLSNVPNIRITGLHSHVSSRTKTAASYRQRAARLFELCRQVAPLADVRIFNVGGGFFGPMPDELREQFPFEIPEVDEYAEAIAGLFRSRFGTEDPDSPHLVVEPGVSLVADTMALVAPIVEVRERRGKMFALVDTSINVVNPTRSAVRRPFVHVKDPENSSGSLIGCCVVGNTCMETDVIVDHCPVPLAEGDFIVFPNRGAYSNNYSPPFIMPPPAIVESTGRVLKERDSVPTVLAPYVVQPAG